MVKGLQPLVWAMVFFLAAATTSAESISVQVQQDAYRVSDVGATGLEVEIRVQNQGPETFENVLLTLPSQNVLSAHPKPAASGTNLVWTVGNLIDGDSFSVRLRVDGSAEGIRLNDVRATGAFGTVRRDITGRVVRLEGPNFPADKLLASADADPTDPAIIHQAGVLGGDPDRIFAFVKSLKHQFYTGSLHGARGALYAGAANRVDRASLLVALLRASGLPAVYRAGTLTAADQLRLATQALATSGALAGVPLTASQMRAQPELALALLPSFEVFNLGATTAQRVAAIRALSDEDLLELVFAPSMPAEVTTYAADQHVWVEAYINGSWVAMDPSFLDAEPGDVIGVPGQQLTGIPEAWRHRVVVSVFHEQMTPTFATGLNLQNPSLVLTRGAGELVGKPVIVSHTTETSSSFGMISYTAQAKYTPTFEVRDLERLDASERIEGQTYTELVSSFGGGISNTYVTSAWLGVELLAPGQTSGQGQVLVQNLADRVGFEARNGVATDLDIDFQVRALDAVDMTTLLVQASHLPARTTRTALQVLSSITEQAQANAAAAELLDPVATPTSEDIEGLKIYAQALTAGLGALHSSNMGERMQRLAEAKQQLPFNVAPRVTSAFARINTKNLRAIYGIDLMHERIEAGLFQGHLLATCTPSKWRTAQRPARRNLRSCKKRSGQTVLSRRKRFFRPQHNRVCAPST